MTTHEAAAVTFRVLGALEAAADRGPIVLKGPRHRAVLARLLVAKGRVVPVDRLVEDLWERPNDGAVGAIRTFVAALRRALEPDRPPRRPARLLVTAAPGYALRTEPDRVDAWAFEAAVGAAGPLLAAGRAGQASAEVDAALGLWRGPAYAEFAAEPWARGEAVRLDGLRLLAVELRARALLDLGRAAAAVPDLAAHAAAHPLREDAWELLALALYRAGRQGEALAAVRSARRALVAELGVDPGPSLRRLEVDLLAQAPHLTPRTGAVAAPSSVVPEPPADGLFGRARDLDLLARAAARAERGGRLVPALISGDAGAGKTALAEALARRLAARGWTIAWGRGPEHEGAPADWPWAQVVAALDPAGPPPAAPATGGAEDPAAARFRAHRAAAAELAEAAGRGPLLLVFEDLHRAGEETLALLTALVTAGVAGPVLLVGTYRATEISRELTDVLAGFARADPARAYLGGLSREATRELVEATLARDVDATTAEVIHRRSAGNPFLARELARLYESEGSAALHAVPAGVRDVIRHRLARLPESARAVLRQAAVLGRDIDLDVLIAMVDDNEEVVLDALESAQVAGFVTYPDADRARFAHALVRDAVYEDVPTPRRSRAHARAGAAIERLRPGDVAALAHHFGRAESRATAARAAYYAGAAAEQAERRFAPHEATRLWRVAVAAYERVAADTDAGSDAEADADADVRVRLTAVMGLVRGLAVTGDLAEARRRRARAIADAERLGDPELTARVITAFDVPAVWTRNDDEDLARQVVEATERTLRALPDEHTTVRGRLLSTLALELRGATTDRGRRAADEAEAIARRSADPALLAFALDGRFMHTFGRAGLAPERAAIGAELVELGAAHDLVTFEVLGRLVLVQARAALGDFAAADAHADAVDRLAERYEIPLVGVFTRWYAALRSAVAGDPARAEAAYRAADAGLAGAGMPGLAEGLLPLALLGLRIAHDEPIDADGWAWADWGPYEPWVRPLLLASAGRRAESAAAARAVPPAPHDLLREVRACLTARTALALGDHRAMARAYAELLPAADELTGAGSGLLTFGPVARHLADLATALNRPTEATEHHRQAHTLTARVANLA